MVERDEKPKHRGIPRSLIPRALFFSFCGLNLLLSASASPATPELNTCVFQRIEERLGKSYKADGGVQLPSTVRIDFKGESPSSLFSIFFKVWQAGENDFIGQRSLIQKVAHGSPLDPTEMAALKLTRARFKQLRFAFFSFDKSHDAPKRLDSLTTQMGAIQDALGTHPPDMLVAAPLAKKLLPVWDRAPLLKIENEIDAFRPSSKKSFYRWIVAELDQLETLLNAKALTEKQFHKARKILARQNAVFFVLNSVEPDPDRTAVLNYLSDWNARVGKLHDKMIRKELRGKKVGRVAFPPPLKSQAERYIQAMRSFLETIER